MTTRSIRERELSTVCMVPHCLRSSAFCQSLRPRVFASNHSFTRSGLLSCWSISRASYTKSSTTSSATASLNL